MRKTKSNNRSTRRTRAAIRSALLEVMERKPLSEITIQEIIDQANVCRTTFYAHFSDIYDLLDDVGNEIIDEVSEKLKSIHYTLEQENSYPTINAVVEIYAKHASTIRLLNSSNGDPMFDQRMQSRIYEVTREVRMQYEGSAFHDQRHQIYSYYVIGGGINLLNHILRENKPFDTEFMGLLLGKMAASAEKTFLQEERLDLTKE